MRRLALAFVAVLWACGDGGGNAPVDATDETGDLATDTVADACAGEKKLSFVDPTDDDGKPTQGATEFRVFLPYAGKRDLEVRLDQGACPTANTALAYSLEEDTQNLYALSATTVFTDASGAAKATLSNVVHKIGEARVKVCVQDEPAVPCLSFLVAHGWGGIPLMVGFTAYTGAYPLIDGAEIRLFKQSPDGKPKCAGLVVGDVATMAATVASPKIPIDGSYSFHALPNLQTDKTQAYTIVGLARHGQGPTQAWACDDAKGHVEWGANLYLDLTLADIPPRAAGAYDATTTIDLATGLPAEAAARVAGLADFVEDPAGETLRVSCLAAGTTGALADFCAVMFASKEAPDLAAMTGVGLAVLTMVRKNVAAGLTAKDAMTAMKVWLTSTLTVSADFDDEGNCSGPACGESWTTFHGQAPGAQVVDVPFGPVDAAVELERKGLAGLMVKSHAVGLGYGQLADLAVEKVLLPARFGGGTPEVATFETAMGAALGKKACLSDGSCCSAFAAAANKAQPGYPESFFKDGCMALTSEGAAWLRARLVGLDPVGGSLKIGTIDPCPMTDVDEDMEVDGIASSAQPCAMDAVFDVGTESFVPQVSFFGTRK